MNKKLLDEYMEKMKAIEVHDTERWHLEADALLSELLRKLGYGPLMDIYDEHEAWYA